MLGEALTSGDDPQPLEITADLSTDSSTWMNSSQYRVIGESGHGNSSYLIPKPAGEPQTYATGGPAANAVDFDQEKYWDTGKSSAWALFDLQR